MRKGTEISHVCNKKTNKLRTSNMETLSVYKDTDLEMLLSLNPFVVV